MLVPAADLSTIVGKIADVEVSLLQRSQPVLTQSRTKADVRPAPDHRIRSINAAANHQPVLVGVSWLFPRLEDVLRETSCSTHR